MMKKNSILFFISLLAFCNANAKVKLPELFTNNMVLQQKSKVKIWGESTAISQQVKVTCSWNNKAYTSFVDENGNWTVQVQTPKFGGPYSISIQDGDELILNNILIGDVWFCSGQSNMEMPLAGWGKINNFQEEIRQADFPEIRLLQVTKNTANVPINDFKTDEGGWNEVKPQTIANFSATAYFFAREVYKQTGIPIGLVHSSWGGTRIESWMSADALKPFDKYTEVINRVSKPNAQQWYEQELANWTVNADRNDTLNQINQGKWFENKDFSNWSSITVPSFFDSEVYPNLDGVVYYSKEVEIPKAMRNKPLKLILGAIDDNDVTYVNQEKVGETVGFNNNRVYTITADNNQAEKLRILIRVTDSGGGGGLYVGQERARLQSEDNQEILLSGEWDFKIGYDSSKLPARPQPVSGSNVPTALYNAMVNPFEDFVIKGVIWYQGESNAESLADANMYKDLFPALIKDWRQKWNNPNMPFLFAQLANYKLNHEFQKDSFWAILRDAQLQATKLPNTGMAVLADIGDSTDIHPKNKQEVGRRLGLIARNLVYKQHVSKGPKVKKWKVKNNKVHITFDSNLTNKSVKSSHTFYIAGNDQKYYPAEVRIEKKNVIVFSSRVDKPVSIYYAWTDNPELLIFNTEGLPASPFHIEVQ